MRNVQEANIGIVGAGAMGQGIAQTAALAGLCVQLLDVEPAASARALSALGAIF